MYIYGDWYDRRKPVVIQQGDLYITLPGLPARGKVKMTEQEVPTIEEPAEEPDNGEATEEETTEEADSEGGEA